eukprot:scaffold3625_cov79-Phaeocystis_antarctica.AAC.3
MRCSRAPTGAPSFEMDEMHDEPGCGPPGAPGAGTPAQARVRVRGVQRARGSQIPCGERAMDTASGRLRAYEGYTGRCVVGRGRG